MSRDLLYDRPEEVADPKPGQTFSQAFEERKRLVAAARANDPTNIIDAKRTELDDARATYERLGIEFQRLIVRLANGEKV